MKIVFFGSSEFAVPALEALKNAHFDIVGAVTVPDQPAGREKVLTPPPLKVSAAAMGIPVFQPATLKDGAFLEEFRSLAPGLAVVAAYGKIIPDDYLSVPAHGFLNIHPSLLPKYRGPTPIQTALLQGESETGVTIMKVDAEMDHGPIVAVEKTDVSPTENYKELHDRLALIGARLLADTIPKYIDGTVSPQEQDHSQATFSKIHPRMQSHINWARTGRQVHDWVRALNPDPGTWSIWRGALMNIRTVEESSEPSTETPGIIQKIGSEVCVNTTSNCVILKRIQLEGKKETSAIEFCQGHPDLIGSELK